MGYIERNIGIADDSEIDLEYNQQQEECFHYVNVVSQYPNHTNHSHFAIIIYHYPIYSQEGSVLGLMHPMSIMIAKMSPGQFSVLSLPIEVGGIVVLGCYVLEIYQKAI